MYEESFAPAPGLWNGAEDRVLIYENRARSKVRHVQMHAAMHQ